MAAEFQFPDALPHGEISEPIPDIYFVTGTMSMGGRLPMRFSRNMTIIKENNGLVLINTVRLSDTGLAALDKLGQVKHIIRLAGFHGMDDPFYKDRYSATVWSVNAGYFKGFNPNAEPYLEPDKVIDKTTKPPISDARFIEIASSKPAEGLIYLKRDGGTLISGDCLQNWSKPDQFFSLPARLMMKMFGFIKPYNVGPGWLKSANPDRKEVQALSNVRFENLLPAHGSPVIGDAGTLYEPVLAKLV